MLPQGIDARSRLSPKRHPSSIAAVPLRSRSLRRPSPMHASCHATRLLLHTPGTTCMHRAARCRSGRRPERVRLQWQRRNTTRVGRGSSSLGIRQVAFVCRPWWLAQTQGEHLKLYIREVKPYQYVFGKESPRSGPPWRLAAPSAPLCAPYLSARRSCSSACAAPPARTCAELPFVLRAAHCAPPAARGAARPRMRPRRRARPHASRHAARRPRAPLACPTRQKSPRRRTVVRHWYTPSRARRHGL